MMGMWRWNPCCMGSKLLDTQREVVLLDEFKSFGETIRPTRYFLP